MPKVRNIIIFVSIALLLVLAYLYFNRSSDQSSLVSGAPAAVDKTDSLGGLPAAENTDSSAPASSPNPDANANTAPHLQATDFLTLLLSVRNLKLDGAIFSDPVFTSLRDSSITLTPDGTEGRPNPFAKFGSDSDNAPAH